MIRKGPVCVAIAAGLICSGLALSAHAQTPRRSESLTGGQGSETQAQRRPGLQFGSDGRWGLNLDVQQPVGREADWNDVDASAHFRLSPSLRLQGSVGLGERRPDPARPAERDRDQPHVRLETIFRF